MSAAERDVGAHKVECLKTAIGETMAMLYPDGAYAFGSLKEHVSRAVEAAYERGKQDAAKVCDVWSAKYRGSTDATAASMGDVAWMIAREIRGGGK